MFDFNRSIRIASLTLAAVLSVSPAAIAQEAATSADDAYSQMESMFGGVPTFMRQFPQGSVAGAWELLKNLELSEETALDNKTKALISLAVAAQIPCDYCIWVDTNSAKQAGATDEEIAEAVAMAGLTRFWSTFLNGMQTDMETFQSEMGGEMAAPAAE